jgi:hypothetical protein
VVLVALGTLGILETLGTLGILETLGILDPQLVPWHR